MRKIIHIDMDAFYASVEQRDDPSLRHRPLAVGGSRERGVVMAASYEARAFGVRSAMPSATARRLCPDLVFVRPRFEAYKAVSSEIRAVFEEHTPIIEPVALDEAYLDVTENLKGLPTATDVARDIRATILARTGLTASAGVSYNKFLAKVASDHRKPDALFVITPAMGPGFVEALPIGQFRGVGPATEAKMKRLGIRTGADLKARSLDELRAAFGSTGDYYYRVARGIDERPVRANRERKSIGAETTFSDDTSEYAVLAERLQPLLDKVWAVATAKAVVARTVTLKLKFSDFAQITRARSLTQPLADRAMLEQVSLGLLRDAFPLRRSVRLIGTALSSLQAQSGEGGPQQLDFAM
ncbi:DNA polymerase IV 2 [Methylorubrum extorquens]|uniref:DNA polymerase IV n=1 Tax=Methylorubrum extorquens TaxID=408 RepID=A0A2N9AN71_METEX|nr:MULTISPECIES: DNA polymerase IV [Methylorubrum]ARO57136.1 DNA polymerase IV [Methylorubrum zatmanii]KQO87916.1 DNA polymerase IV [Methylobacterium sp. Leaf90]WHQ72025.1 DNA polymerase IV [Methylorubrum extorquens]SOR28742.1 DNA polymerase IV 2 [Methylorubrum extorquens]